MSVLWVFPSFLLQNNKFNSHSYASPAKFFLNTLQEKVPAKMQFIPLLVHSEMQHLNIQNFTKVGGNHSHPIELCLNSDISKGETTQITSLYDY